MITATQLSKQYGLKSVVNDVSFSLEPGQVTGFLGPNGAGKSTTMRMIMGHEAPTSGSVTVCGKPFVAHSSPMRVAGAMLDAKSVHPRRTPLRHLRGLALTQGIPMSRVHEVIELTGLGSVAQTPAGKFSLGMGQRLGIAAALLGDPQVLVLDEPVNGLDPDGVRWIRELARDYAKQGKTVLVSSHLMSEMEKTADRLLIIGRGRIIVDAPITELLANEGDCEVRVVSDAAVQLGELLRAEGASSTQEANSSELRLQNISAQRVGEIAAQHAIALRALEEQTPTLEDVYHRLTQYETQYVSGSRSAAQHPSNSSASKKTYKG